MLEKDSIADKTKRPIPFGVVLVFVLYGASIARTLTRADDFDRDSRMIAVEWAIPSMLIGSLVGFFIGVAIERCIDEAVPLWMFPLTLALLPLWFLNILVFPGSPL